MPDLNLRGVEALLIAELKSSAALAQMTLKEFCVMVLRSANFREVPSEYKTATAANRDAEVDVPKVAARIANKINSARSEKNSIARPQISVGADLAVGDEIATEIPAPARCSECFAVTGHYKTCSKNKK